MLISSAAEIWIAMIGINYATGTVNSGTSKFANEAMVKSAANRERRWRPIELRGGSDDQNDRENAQQQTNAPISVVPLQPCFMNSGIHDKFWFDDEKCLKHKPWIGPETIQQCKRYQTFH